MKWSGRSLHYFGRKDDTQEKEIRRDYSYDAGLQKQEGGKTRKEIDRAEKDTPPPFFFPISNEKEVEQYFLIYSSQVIFFICLRLLRFFRVGGYPHLVVTSYPTLIIGKSPSDAFTLLNWS